MKMTGEEFEDLIEKEPSWCKNLKKPLEVTTYVNLTHSPITHLSPFITFTGENEAGWGADFSYCEKLEIAECNSINPVAFGHSGIKEVRNLKIKQTSGGGWNGDLFNCKNLISVPLEYTSGNWRLEKAKIKKSITKYAVDKIKAEANNLKI